MKFEHSQKGYMEAKTWLIENDLWDEVSTKGFSCDGWSLVHSANSLYKKKYGSKDE